MYLEENRNALVAILLGFVTCGIYTLIVYSRIANDTNIICAGDGEKDCAGIGMFILLTILTCGIYSVYWFYRVGDRLQRNGGRYNVYIGESGIVYLILCFIPFGSIINLVLLFKNLNSLSIAFNQGLNNMNNQKMF